MRLSSAAADSAGDLARAARILLEAGLFGPAASLAVLSREEAAKSFLSRVWAISEIWDAEAWRCLFVSHRKKHGGAIGVEVLSKLSDDVNALVAKLESRVRKRLPHATDGELNRAGMAYLLGIARFVMPRIWRHIGELFQSQQGEWKSRVVKGQLDNVKMKGFYADWDSSSDEVSSPRSISRESAEELVRSAEDAVRTIGFLAFANAGSHGDDSDETRRALEAVLQCIPDSTKG